MKKIGTLFILLLSLACLSPATSQTDSLKNVGFARFLIDQKLYELAAQEYERLCYLYPTERKHLLSLFNCYRQIGAHDKIEKRSQNSNLENEDILKEYLLSLALSDQIDIAKLIYKDKSNLLNPLVSKRLGVDFELLKGNYLEADEKYSRAGINDYKYLDLIKEGKSLKLKSSTKAGLLSGVVPGLGRFYANDKKDGIISFLFIAATSYQSYRRFKSGGVNSVSAWIYGGFSAGFYISNIYGSVKSAKRYNKKLKNNLYEKTKSYINSFYSI